ncbi:MAG: formyltransferase family protein [Rikenellaceae bacterium]|nr:formyltransferase family protein [Rikenellaceae bacterium]
MHIGLISNSDLVIPTAASFVSLQFSFSLYIAPSRDPYINEKVRQFALQSRINITFGDEKGEKLYEWLKKGKYDIVFVISYSHIIEINRIGNSTELFNVHFGPLPAYQGPIPVFWQLKNGESQLGMVIHRMTMQFDRGPVIWSKNIPNQHYYNFRSVMLLFSQLCVEGILYIIQIKSHHLPLAELERKQIVPSCQRNPELKDIIIVWKTMPSIEICNLIRACNPWNKGAITFLDRKEVKIIDANPIDEQSDLPAGSIIQDKVRFKVVCSDRNLLQVNMLIFQDFYCSGENAIFFRYSKFQKIRR